MPSIAARVDHLLDHCAPDKRTKNFRKLDSRRAPYREEFLRVDGPTLCVVAQPFVSP